MKKGTIIKRTDYVATMLAIPVGEEHEFTLTGRDYASYMNAVSRFNKNGKAKFEARTASASTIVINGKIEGKRFGTAPNSPIKYSRTEFVALLEAERLQRAEIVGKYGQQEQAK